MADESNLVLIMSPVVCLQNFTFFLHYTLIIKNIKQFYLKVAEVDIIKTSFVQILTATGGN
jgi:hypothetical protein